MITALGGRDVVQLRPLSFVDSAVQPALSCVIICTQSVSQAQFKFRRRLN